MEGDCSAERLRHTVRFGYANLLTGTVVSVDAQVHRHRGLR